MTQSFQYPEHLAPARLDKAMAVALGLGLRRCRVLIEAGLVLVDERPFPKGGLVGPGQRVSIAETVEPRSSCPAVAVVARSESYAALAKPAAVHSVAGRGDSCLESCLPGLALAGWQLLNRLDYLTSGDTAVVGIRFRSGYGYSRATASAVKSWPVLARAGGVTVRRPLPADAER